MDPLSGHHDLHHVLRTNLLYLEFYRGARFALHPVGAFLAGQPVGADPVDLHDLVSAGQSVLLGRRSLVRLVDDDVPVLLRLVDDRPDASVGLIDHHHQILVLLLRNVNRVRIQTFQHRVDARPLDPVHRQRIHVRPVEFLENGILDLSPFPELEAL